MKKYIVFLTMVLFIFSTNLVYAEGTPVATDKAPKAIGPYSQAMWAGDFLYLSGQLGIVPATGKLIEGGTLAQSEQIFRNSLAILESQGLSFKDVVKVNIYGLDIKEFVEVNKLYATYFSTNFPARAFVQVSALPAGASIEIEMIAYRKPVK